MDQHDLRYHPTLGQRSRPLYMIEIKGSNAAPSRVGLSEEGTFAITSGETGWVAVRRYGPKGNPIALYTSRSVAVDAAAAGQLWNGQSYRVRAARGNAKVLGRVMR